VRHERDDELQEALKALDPVAGDDLHGWVEGEDGRRIHDRIVASRESSVEAAPTRSRSLRPVLAAIAVLVVVVAIVIAVAAGVGSPSEQAVVTTGTSAATGVTAVASTGTSTTAPENAVGPLVALGELVDLAEAVQGSAVTESPTPPPTDPAGYVTRAQAVGITLPAERDVVLSAQYVSRGVYSLWVWRAFADTLVRQREVDFQDLDSLSDEMREAVIGVVGAGILDGRSDTRFEADQPLTSAEEQEAVTRLERALGLKQE
jgi:hypothetical protein